MTEKKTELATQMPKELAAIYWKAFWSQGSNDNFFRTLRIDSDKAEFKINMWEDNIVYLWSNIVGQILFMATYYNNYSDKDEMVVMDTNKFQYWETIVIYDYLNGTIHDFKSKKEFDSFKKELGEWTKLKYQRVLYIKILEWELAWEIVEMFVKLSQSHWIDKEKKFTLDNPLPDWLGIMLNEYKDNMPLYKLNIGINSYTQRPITVDYPTFKVIEATPIDPQEVITLIDKIKQTNLYKLQKFVEKFPNCKIRETEESFDDIPSTARVVEAEVISKDDDTLPWEK